MTSVRGAGTTSTATLFGLALTIGLTHLTAPRWIEAAGLDVWDVPALRNEIKTEAKVALDLDIELDECKRCISLKDHLIDNLRAGRTTLKKVTTQFLTLNQTQPERMLLIRLRYEGATDEEKTAKNVLAFVIQRKSGSWVQEAEVLARLMTEFRQLTGNPTAELR